MRHAETSRVWTPQAARHVAGALARLTETGQGDVKRLTQVDPPEYRLRVGDWRVRFELAEAPEPTLVVLHVLPRGKAYR